MNQIHCDTLHVVRLCMCDFGRSLLQTKLNVEEKPKAARVRVDNMLTVPYFALYLCVYYAKQCAIKSLTAPTSPVLALHVMILNSHGQSIFKSSA
jgi:hypothetical protein